ncbi:hypothetical protein ESZ50_08760 [Weissella muntiaci]|uniref:Uncharacterized protein n=1 Tax=Weissella muntiaci TaxID=2508881 RepID=A0A6C2C3W1_9LACO|nr:hypothetical protein [Weissella muntiaci]TYC48442.1 hypothetical protein ESZ50_08760 [Weissella muntiaci]
MDAEAKRINKIRSDDSIVTTKISYTADGMNMTYVEVRNDRTGKILSRTTDDLLGKFMNNYNGPANKENTLNGPYKDIDIPEYRDSKFNAFTDDAKGTFDAMVEHSEIKSTYHVESSTMTGKEYSDSIEDQKKEAIEDSKKRTQQEYIQQHSQGGGIGD